MPHRKFHSIREAFLAVNDPDPVVRRKARRLVAKRGASMERAARKRESAKTFPFAGVVRDARGDRNLGYLRRHGLVAA